jgi:transposase
MLLQQMAKAQDGGLVGPSSYAEIDAGEAAKHRRLIEGVFHTGIGKTEPLLQEVGAKHDALADSLALRQFVRIGLTEQTPDHSTISRTRRLIDVETHRAVFSWALELLADRGFIQGKRVGIDATTLEASAAMRSIVRRDTGESYEEFLTRLAKASGIKTPTREQLARLDRRRKKRTSNKEWKSPTDADARVTKMKDGRTHLAHKAEHAVDLDTGAVVAMTLQEADKGDTATLDVTLQEAGETVADLAVREAELHPEARAKVNIKGIEEMVADKGYHSGAALERVKRNLVRTYIPERQQKGRRNWEGKAAEQQAVYANRRRVQGIYGKSLLRRRGELVERSFAHCYDTGGMRLTHLRKHDNILKRLLIHVAGFNLSLTFRKMLGAAPRGSGTTSAEGRFLPSCDRSGTGMTLQGPANARFSIHADKQRRNRRNRSGQDATGESLLTPRAAKGTPAQAPDFELAKQTRESFRFFDQNQDEKPPDLGLLGDSSGLQRPFSGLQRHYAPWGTSRLRCWYKFTSAKAAQSH